MRTALLLSIAALSSAADAPYLAQTRQFYSLPDNDVRAVWTAAGRVYVRTATSSFEFAGTEWKQVSKTPPQPKPSFPEAQQAAGLRQVRGVARSGGRACFVAHGLAGCKTAGQWQLWSTADGLPYGDLTSVAIADDGSVWFGSNIGAMRFDGRRWEYRQGPRWLPNDEIRGVAVLGATTFFATANGVGAIEQKPATLREKAEFFERAIDLRHRRTEHEYVLGVAVGAPGDTSKWAQHDSDNDGLWTAMYGAGECFACATGIQSSCERARKAFDALRFLGTVTQGGKHSPPRGYVARTVLPATGPDPNLTYTPERDRQFRATRDPLWKIMDPRWPRSADGRWYWKADTSSDELDGHYFLYGLYYDLVANTNAEKQRVRDHVAALTDHLVEHNYQLIDHDGKPTRWAVFNPERLNRDPEWIEERGLNSISILSYLATAFHITGHGKYADAARTLRDKHGYDINTLVAKSNGGPGSGNQSDDEMAFMCLYNLVKYEPDSRLRSIYKTALRQRWEVEEPELNPLFNFIAAAALGLNPGSWLDESLDTLRRYPRDRFNWPARNSHRSDIVQLRGSKTRGHKRDGRVLPIDERFVEHWNVDPWQLDYKGDGRRLADATSFLLPYYMGRHYRFID